MKIIALLVALCALPQDWVAAEPEVGGMILAQQEAAGSKPAAEPGSDPNKAEPARSGSGQGKPASGDRFKPSERIRADSPVSFPVDI
jgi:hypothetical protein